MDIDGLTRSDAFFSDEFVGSAEHLTLVSHFEGTTLTLKAYSTHQMLFKVLNCGYFAQIDSNEGFLATNFDENALHGSSLTLQFACLRGLLKRYLILCLLSIFKTLALE